MCGCSANIKKYDLSSSYRSNKNELVNKYLALQGFGGDKNIKPLTIKEKKAILDNLKIANQ
jgi:hypothetical protein